MYDKFQQLCWNLNDTPLMIFIAMAVVRTLAANGAVALETIVDPDDT